VKILTIVGTRPEIIRLSVILSKLDILCKKHIIVHTGQNYDKNLNDVFFNELKLRRPDYYLNAKGSLSEQMASIWTGMESVLEKEHPDKILVLGDTNSSLGAVIAKRMGFPIYHMEAGNRCFSDLVPEEINRRIIDHSSDVLLPYTERSRMNLIKEGIDVNKIYVTGNPIYEVIKKYEKEINKYAVEEIHKRKYFLVTLHRAETVSIKEKLEKILQALDLIQKNYNIPIYFSLHPHTRNKMIEFNLKINNPNIYLDDPYGFFKFSALEKDALCVLSDSGTVCEETSIFGVPCVTLRDVTERPETLECGSNILSGVDIDNILVCTKLAIENKGHWLPPIEYTKNNVSDTVIKILFSKK
jgi:UDP-N-acetylglucosamine 2-epimerase (non-hydrolysing)